MKDSKSRMLLIGAALLTAAWLVSWVMGLVLNLEAMRGWHSLTLGFTFALAVGAICLWVRHVAKRQQQAQQFFETLLRSEPAQLARLASGTDSFPLSPSNPWFASAQEFSERFAQNCAKLQQAEQSRTALEVRLRRGAGRQEQIEAILAGLAEPVVAINAFDELILINPAVQSLFETDEKTAAGQPLVRVLHCELLVDLLTETRRRKSLMRRGEIELIDDEENSRWFTVTCGSLAPDEGDPAAKSHSGNGAHNRRGKAAGAFAVLRDATESKAGQKRYAEFVSAVSHEMKSPLAGIKAYVELLADGDADDRGLAKNSWA